MAKRAAQSTAAEVPGESSHERFPTVSRSDEAVNRGFAIEAARLLSDDKCTEVVVMDVRGLSQVADYLVIASGTSDRQMKSAADDVAKLAATMNCPSFRRNTDDRTTWVLLDCVDVVVHVFEPNTRSHYDLEMLWGDAPRVEWERPADAARPGVAPSAAAQPGAAKAGVSRPGGPRDRAGLGR